MFDSMLSLARAIPAWGWADIAFTVMVVAGVAGESTRIAEWLAAHFVPKTLGQKMLVGWKSEEIHKWAEFLVIFGVAGEVLCLAFSLNEDVKLSIHLQELTRENLAEKMLWEPRGGRFDVVEFENKLKPLPKSNIEILFSPEDEESFQFAKGLSWGLTESGWVVTELRPFSESDALVEKPSIIPLINRVGAIARPAGCMTIQLKDGMPKMPSLGSNVRGLTTNTPAGAFIFAFIDSTHSPILGTNFGNWGWVPDVEANPKLPNNMVRLIIPPNNWWTTYFYTPIPRARSMSPATSSAMKIQID